MSEMRPITVEECQSKSTDCSDRIGCRLTGICYIGQTTSKSQPRIPQLITLLESVKSIHIKKNQDYATESNPYSNFEFAARLSEDFKDPVDKVFVTLIGVKLARLSVLL